MRISIIGLNAGGKSTLAEAISKKLSIPHIHLDRFWFEAGGAAVGKQTPVAERERIRAYVKEKTLAAIAADSWVSDGFYARLQPEIARRADVVIFLDIPLWRRLFNHAKRMMSPQERHSELNFLHELGFFSEIIRRSMTYGPKLSKFLNEFKDKIVVLKSNTEVERYLRSLQ